MLRTMEATIDEQGHVELNEPIVLSRRSRALVTILEAGPQQTQARFAQLAARWRAETAFTSSTTDLVTNEAYQQIVAMGTAVLPDILSELSRHPDHWNWALHHITGAEPVPIEHAGNLKLVQAAWLKWAKANGYDVG